jgi:lipoate-protein ligase B
VLSVWCGEVVYEDGLRWQGQLAEARATDAIDDVLLTLTHDPVYTAGRHADLAHNLLGDVGVRVVAVERGGDVTYHGPGQLVAYPIIKLTDAKGARAYVDALVTACVRTAASYGLDARADHDRPGVWVGADKLAAVGVRITNRVTSHGLAFNVAPDLALFRAGIVPCGISDGGVCSLASLGVDTTLEEVRRRLVAQLADTLDRPIQTATLDDLGLVPTHSPDDLHGPRNRAPSFAHLD